MQLVESGALTVTQNDLIRNVPSLIIGDISWSDHRIERCTRDEEESFLDVLADGRANLHIRNVSFALVATSKTEQSTRKIWFNLVEFRIFFSIIPM